MPLSFKDQNTCKLMSLQGGGEGGGGVLPGILVGGVLPGSPNPDPVSDQKMTFSTPVFRCSI